jgi:hypothetical protein
MSCRAAALLVIGAAWVLYGYLRNDRPADRRQR